MFYCIMKKSLYVIDNSNMRSFKRFESKPVVKITFIYDRLGTDHLTSRGGGGGGYVFFSKKIF